MVSRFRRRLMKKSWTLPFEHADAHVSPRSRPCPSEVSYGFNRQHGIVADDQHRLVSCLISRNNNFNSCEPFSVIPNEAEAALLRRPEPQAKELVAPRPFTSFRAAADGRLREARRHSLHKGEHLFEP
jgi:hypothetical protein